MCQIDRIERRLSEMADDWEAAAEALEGGMMWDEDTTPFQNGEAFGLRSSSRALRNFLLHEFADLKDGS